jgi:hypothetical protein
MLRRGALVLAYAALALGGLACKEERAPAAATPAPRRPAAFTLRDLALATAVDARAAKVALVAGDLEEVFVGAPDLARGAGSLLGMLEIAQAELDQVARAVANPLDRTMADAVAARGAAYARELAAFARGGATPGSVAHARNAFGDAVATYHHARVGWRLEAPERGGEERAFTEARRALEVAEASIVSGAHDASALHATAPTAARRARAAAARLPPGMRDAALRWAAAQEDVLGAVVALAVAEERERPVASRAYQVAKVDALLALADYFAAVAAR